MKRILLLILVLLALGASWTLYWNHSAQQLDAGFQIWVRERQAEGYQVAYETAEVAGYPTETIW